jgi:hypothetical protein
MPVHEPLWQLSACVHALPSLHVVPSALGGSEQMPLAGLHMPATWHWSLALQTTEFVPVHEPAWQASVCVHRLPSLHGVPLAFGGSTHSPVAGLHVPAL